MTAPLSDAELAALDAAATRALTWLDERAEYEIDEIPESKRELCYADAAALIRSLMARLRSAEARVAELEKLLDDHGTHLPQCELRLQGDACSCGWSETTRRLADGGGA